MQGMPDRSVAGDPSILFEAIIMPHRSLSRRGLRILIAFFGAMSALTGVRFWVIGAWPVAGFIVIEIGLAAFLLWLHQRSGREVELLLLSARAIRVVRTDAAGRKRELLLPAGWLTVDLEERPGRVPGLLLCAPGRRLEVATALGDEAKRDLAAALRNAVHDVRNPRFDNLQLREPGD